MRLTILLLLAINLFSCGKESAPEPGCSSDISSIQKVWTSNSTDAAYDIRDCTPGETCTLSSTGVCGESAGDITLLYNEGAITYTDCITNQEFTANWRVCSNVLEFYNYTDGSPTETFR